QAGGRLGGHLVLGHVDGRGELLSRRAEGDAGPSQVLRFAAPAAVATYLVEKGSATINGVSLTVGVVEPLTGGGAAFDVFIIPHTLTRTTLGELAPGAPVNMEADIVGKYVHKFVAATGQGLGAPARPDGAS